MATPQNDIYIGSPDHPGTTAVVSYITFIGWLLAAFLLLSAQRTRFSAFHMRQAFVLHMLSLLLKIAYSFTLNAGNMVFAFIVSLCVLLFLLWLRGFLYAINGEEKEVPLVGRLAQTLLRNWWR